MRIVAKEALLLKRIKAGYTRKQFSEKIGMTTQGYRNIEVGSNGTKADQAQKITEALGAEFEDLFQLK